MMKDVFVALLRAVTSVVVTLLVVFLLLVAGVVMFDTYIKAAAVVNQTEVPYVPSE